jgi:hypothetical protein
VKKLAFIFLICPWINFNCLALCLKFRIIFNAFCTAENQIASFIWTTFNIVISCTQTDLLIFIKINSSYSFGIFIFVDNKLRSPNFFNIFYLNRNILEIYFIILTILWLIFKWWIGLYNSDIVFKHNKLFSTDIEVNFLLVKIFSEWLDR